MSDESGTPSDLDALELIGTTIEGKYLIERVVGSGGFALVYRAQHLVWKRPVAVKAFRALAELAESQREALVEEFVREGALLGELSERSAAIVQARDIGTLVTKRGEHIPFMILEWLDGASLDKVLADEAAAGLAPRTLQAAVALLNPIAEALALAHKKGIAHRDVKPPNVFVLGDPRGDHATKLLDFGIAKVVQDAQKMSGSFQKTGGHVTSFTPAYGAPEQFSRTHGATGPWTDVFALALLMTEVLTGKAPLEGDTFVQLGFASADASRRPTPRTLGAAVPDAVEAVLEKALAVAPERRYQTAGEFWGALREASSLSPMQALGDLPASSARPAVADPSAFGATVAVPTPVTPAQANEAPVSARAATAPHESKGALRIAAGVAVIGIAALAAVYFTRQGAPTPAPAPSATPPAMASAPAPAPTGGCPEGALLVPGGPFYMGSEHVPGDQEYLKNELPAHPVELAAYCIDRHEVTVARYMRCSDAGKCLRADKENRITPPLTPAQRAAYDPLCNANQPDAHAEHPINCIDFDQASRFCEVRGGRLPTEAEWELAARGPDGRLYPWGDDAPGQGKANACGSECIAWAKKSGVEADFPMPMYTSDDGYYATAPVGSFPAGKSRYGVEDVVGNVWEWTADYYAPYTKDTHTTVSNPKGPTSGVERVIRGGAWNSASADWARPTFRFKAPPDQRTHGIGFRCVYTPKGA